jgi:hypothetical protein
MAGKRLSMRRDGLKRNDAIELRKRLSGAQGFDFSSLETGTESPQRLTFPPMTTSTSTSSISASIITSTTHTLTTSVSSNDPRVRKEMLEKTRKQIAGAQGLWDK